MLLKINKYNIFIKNKLHYGLLDKFIIEYHTNYNKYNIINLSNS